MSVEMASPVCYADEADRLGRYGGGMKAVVTVGLKPGVLDVQGKAVAGALKDLGFPAVEDARVGKVIEIELDGNLDPATAEAQVREMCEALLANTVIEGYRVEILRTPA
jgi:phosphoribosylformylglycinamidine synthase PurS subunit